MTYASASRLLYRVEALTRLTALAPLDTDALSALETALTEITVIPARREILGEGREIARASIVVSGWAARVRLLPDGRRQFLSLLLPGDLIGLCRQPRPIAVSTIVALTEVMVCPAPPADGLPALDHAYAMSSAIEEANLLAQITRLGRLNAQERIADLLLELLERLQLAGLAADGSFEFPVTQESFADMLGLTSVHINRMIQVLRREGSIVWKGRRLTIKSPAALARSIGRVAPRVSAG